MKRFILSILFVCLMSLPYFYNDGLDIKNIYNLKFGKTSLNYAMLATNLGISKAAADKAMTVIDDYGDAVMVISLVGIVVGGGVVTAGLVAVARKLAIRYGRAYAVAW